MKINKNLLPLLLFVVAFSLNGSGKSKSLKMTTSSTSVVWRKFS